MTISELAMMKKACVMIPSPNVVDNHQYKNAKVLSDANAVVLLEESNLTLDGFREKLDNLIADSKRREELAQNIVQFANLDANQLIFDEVLKLTKK